MTVEGPGKEEKIEVGAFRPEDAPGVTQLFRAVYGDGYPVGIVYDAAKLIAAFNSGENIPIVAKNERGEVVGYEAFYRSAPNPRLYELGQGLILPEYRKRGIPNKLQEYACEKMMPGMEADAVFGEAVCNHVYMQKSWAESRTIATALEVDLMPAEAYVKERSASGRVAALPMFRTYHSYPHTIYMPEGYEELFSYIYGELDDERTLAPAPQRGGMGASPTAIGSQVFEFAKVARIEVHEAGDDFPLVFGEEERRVLGQGVLVIQVWLKLSWPWVGDLAGYMRGKGYFTGGVLPRWLGEDALLMQKIGQKPNWEGIQLYSDRAMEILRTVKNDWIAVQK
jgi:hypothetical protein